MPVFRKLKVKRRRAKPLLYKVLPHRCGRCQARRTLRIERGQTWRERARLPACQTCGNKGYYLDRYQMKQHKKLKCNCGGYEFPHRKGGGYCYENPKAEILWTARMNESNDRIEARAQARARL